MTADRGVTAGTTSRGDERLLLTDLYEFTMAAAYHSHGMLAPATFSLFVREYPPDRAYFVSAGIADVLELLEEFRFPDEDLDHLESTGLFSQEFLHYLGGLRFLGEVRAVPEGRLFFRDEPVLEVTAPIPMAQLIETRVINAVGLQVMIATKASRCVHAARGRRLVDFSLRRAQGADAGLKVARACYLAGFEATSNVLAGKRYGIPTAGTMAHSFVTSFPEEAAAFRAFSETFPEHTVLLIDTYDTVKGAEKAAALGKEMQRRGAGLKGVRLDSGDMAALSKQVRKRLDEAGLKDVKIFASGGFDEFKIAACLEEGAEIDAFGVGTKVGVSADAPYLDIAYKLVKYDGRPVLKLSSGKKTLVEEKQVFRVRSGDALAGDTIALSRESLEGEPLLELMMIEGIRAAPRPTLGEMRGRLADDLAALPEAHKALKDPRPYPVGLSAELKRLQSEIVQEVVEKELGES